VIAGSDTAEAQPSPKAASHLAFAVDESWAMPLAVALVSIGARLTAPATAWVVHDQMAPSTQQRVEESIEGLPVTVRWCDATATPTHHRLPYHERFPRAMYARLLVPELVPQALDRVLYLDSDVIARDDVGDLVAHPLDGAVVGAVRDAWYPWCGTSPGLRGSGAVDEAAPYFNSGVLLLDLEQWRELEITDRVLAHLRRCPSTRFADQDAVNAVAVGRVREVAPRWNQQPSLHTRRGRFRQIYDLDTIRAARLRPAIVHFAARVKPWHARCGHPARADWYRELRRTAWRDWVPPEPALVARSWDLSVRTIRRVVNADWDLSPHRPTRSRS
jgi:lipopolysaccharide biosynthesis glycosyltransferase